MEPVLLDRRRALGFSGPNPSSFVMITADPSQNADAIIPAKKSIFNKPSWSKPQALTGGADLFRRSNQTYVDLAKERERQRTRKIARKEKERAQRTEGKEQPGKRRRVSESEGDDNDDSSSDSSSLHSDLIDSKAKNAQTEIENETHVSSPLKPKYSPKSLLNRYEASVAAHKSELNKNQKIPRSHIIDLEDEDTFANASGETGVVEITTANFSKASTADNESISDEEFPELARQARERARRKQSENDIASIIPDSPSIAQDSFFQASQNIDHSTPLRPPPDPILQIFITSSIPNTAPLIANRKLSQRLKDVRIAWVERQHLPSEIADKVFLTWRGKRLFDVTSCRSLGISAGSNGRILAKGENVIDDEGRIHMEATTVEILEAHKKAKTNDLPNEEDMNQEPVIVEEKQEAQVRIICRAKGFADFKLIVKPVHILRTFI